jgi:hypothetical protein
VAAEAAEIMQADQEEAEEPAVTEAMAAMVDRAEMEVRGVWHKGALSTMRGSSHSRMTASKATRRQAEQEETGGLEDLVAAPVFFRNIAESEVEKEVLVVAEHNPRRVEAPAERAAKTATAALAVREVTVAPAERAARRRVARFTTSAC